MKKYIFGFLLFILVLVITAMANSGGSDEGSLQEEPAAMTAFAALPEEAAEQVESAPEEETAPVVVDVSRMEIPEMTHSNQGQLLSRIGFTTSYNTETRCPNWVAWHLTSKHTDGPFPRKGVPYYDEDGKAIGIGYVTPETCRGPYFFDREADKPSPTLEDYTNMSYNMSHGHLCPAGDNKWSRAAMNQSFLLTNMCPQDEQLNMGDWRILEERCRKWAQHYGELFIVAGPIFQGGMSRTVGKGKVGVPDAFFKAVLRLGNDSACIGFIYPNEGERHEMNNYVLSIDELEQRTGIDFFPNLPDEVEEELEREADLNQWK